MKSFMLSFGIVAFLVGCTANQRLRDEGSDVKQVAKLKPHVSCKNGSKGLVRFFSQFGEVQFIKPDGSLERMDDSLNFSFVFAEVFPPITTVTITHKEGDVVGSYSFREGETSFKVKYLEKTFNDCSNVEEVSGSDVKPIAKLQSHVSCKNGSKGLVRFFSQFGEVQFIKPDGSLEKMDDGLNFSFVFAEVFPPITTVTITHEEGDVVGSYSFREGESSFKVKYLEKTFNDCSNVE